MRIAEIQLLTGHPNGLLEGGHESKQRMAEDSLGAPHPALHMTLFRCKKIDSLQKDRFIIPSSSTPNSGHMHWIA
jgi:hypothetical protein